MGDIVQALPAVSDAIAHNPDIKFDWVVDRTFAEVPRWHPAINKLIISNHRQWKKNFKQHWHEHAIQKFYHELRAEKYDLIIDAQSNLKSALITKLARGYKVGVDRASVHEYGAQFAYNKKVYIDKNEHHIMRIRKLFAAAFGYEFSDTTPDFCIQNFAFPACETNLPEKFFFFAPNASRANKLWPVAHWQEMVNLLQQEYHEHKIVIPWYSEVEKARVELIAHNNTNIVLIGKCSIGFKAYAIQRATACISTDTGLAHIAGALDTPNITLYGPSNPTLCKVLGKEQAYSVATTPNCVPCRKQRCAIKDLSQENSFAPCMESLTAKDVYTKLTI